MRKTLVREKSTIKVKRGFLDTFKALAIALALIFLLKYTFVEANQIVSASMSPTLKDGDFILVNKIKYGLHLPFMDRMLLVWSDPKRGDVVTFITPEEKPSTAGKVYIKRVVAVSGDVVEIRDSRLFINSLPLLTHRMPKDDIFHEYNGYKGYEVLKRDKKYSFGPFVVPGGFVFAVGDNRDSSYDSREWGPLPIENIAGKAELIYFTKVLSGGLSNIKRIGKRL